MKIDSIKVPLSIIAGISIALASTKFYNDYQTKSKLERESKILQASAWPAPLGELQIHIYKDDPVNCEAKTIGFIFYNTTKEEIRLCDGISTWNAIARIENRNGIKILVWNR